MAKKIHLICNAHLDPVWHWQWEEGAAEALSTFRIAAGFCEEYDGFVFCHNEALLYQWVEEYEPELFEKIRALVAAGKWNIMGGWHLQPDCNMPSGEFFARQIFAGRKYFYEKFGVVPKTAVNVDPFGHSRGLVQIMKKSGYDGYLFMRPWEGDRYIQLPDDVFTWKGYDGSEVTGVRIKGHYFSQKGKAVEKVREFIADCPEEDFTLCLWGIGNHGGGPSKKDLDDLAELDRTVASDGVELIHSTPDEFVREARERRSLGGFAKSLNPWGVGCYTSQIRVKQQYRRAESLLLQVETMCAQAELAGLMEYPSSEIGQTMYDILTVQFHDSLPGTSVQPVEQDILQMLAHASEILTRLKARAFFALCKGQPKAEEDKIPVLAYNPYPYPLSGTFTLEFNLWDQNFNNEFLKPHLFDCAGNPVPCQCEKELSNMAFEWRKRVTFRAELAPMSVNRFDCAFESLPAKPEATLPCDATHFVFERGDVCIKINRTTGLVDEYTKGGVRCTAPDAFALDVYADNYDPWGMLVTSYPDHIGTFTLASKEEAGKFCALESIEPIHVIENGDVRVIVEAVFCYGISRALVKYILSENAGLELEIRLLWAEKQKMVKLRVPTAFGAKTCLGEHPYGCEELKGGLEENVAHRYITVTDGKHALCAINNGTYGSSFDETRGILNLSMVRSPIYTGHPGSESCHRGPIPADRYSIHMDQGELLYRFAFAAGEYDKVMDTAPRMAQEFQLQPMMLSFYPDGSGEKPISPLTISGDVIQFTMMKRAEVGDGQIIRLFNPTERPQESAVTFLGNTIRAAFGPFEIKTFRGTKETLVETDLLEGLL